MERRETVKSSVDEFDHVHAETIVDGMPKWADRELSSEFVEAVQKRPGIDKPFLIITLVLLTIGLIMVLSASFASANYMTGEPLRFFLRQLAFAAMGVAVMLLVSRISVRTMSRWSTHLLFVSTILLILVLIIGIRVNGATRWLGVGGEYTIFSFQPSEIAKLAVILAFAQMICKFGRTKMKRFKHGVLPFCTISAVLVLLLLEQPHVSAAIIILAITAIMMFAGGTRVAYFLALAILAVVAISVIMIPNLISSAREGGVQGVAEQVETTEVDFGRLGHAGRRLDSWLDPDADPLGGGFQIRQSLNAIGSGGLLGQGLGQSRQKHMYLPEEHNDFIFAIIAEELGFIGSMLILMLFALLVIRGYWLALHAKDRYSALVVIGISSLLAIQVFLNVAVVTNLVPATGISLPLFSYGGTALLIQLVQMGIVLSVSREIPLVKQDESSNEQEIQA